LDRKAVAGVNGENHRSLLYDHELAQNVFFNKAEKFASCKEEQSVPIFLPLEANR